MRRRPSTPKRWSSSESSPWLNRIQIRGARFVVAHSRSRVAWRLGTPAPGQTRLEDILHTLYRRGDALIGSDATLLLARGTDWREIGATHAAGPVTTTTDAGSDLGGAPAAASTLPPLQYRGLGQHLLSTSAAECGLLEVREIVLAQPAAEPSTDDQAPAA